MSTHHHYLNNQVNQPVLLPLNACEQAHKDADIHKCIHAYSYPHTAIHIQPMCTGTNPNS